MNGGRFPGSRRCMIGSGLTLGASWGRVMRPGFGALAVVCTGFLAGCADLKQEEEAVAESEPASPNEVYWQPIDSRKMTLPVLDQTYRPLGSGFREVTIATSSNSEFEALAHYSFLYYGDQLLGDASPVSMSPSGRYVAYVTPQSIEVFDTVRNKVRVLPKPFFVPRDFYWVGNEDSLLARGGSRRERSAVPLN